MFLPKLRIVLQVRNADKSAAFYEALLGAKPAHRAAGAARFETDSPPLFLTVEEAARAAARPTRARFALWVESPRRVGSTAVALRRIGARLRLEDRGIEAVDPDGNAWRIRLAATPQALAGVSKEQEPC